MGRLNILPNKNLAPVGISSFNNIRGSLCNDKWVISADHLAVP